MIDPDAFPPLDSLPFCKGDCGLRLRPASTAKMSTWRRRFPSTTPEHMDGYCYRDYNTQAAGHDPNAELPAHYATWLRNRNARIEKDRKATAPAQHAHSQKVEQK